MPPEGARDLIFHGFRAGAPFEAGDDLGPGSKEKPFAFNYPRHGIEKKGNAPCVDQRIDVWVSLLYDYERVPPGFPRSRRPHDSRAKH